MKVGLTDALQTYFEQGGFIMWPLVACTLILWYALGFRLVTLRRGTARSVYVLIEEYAKGKGPAPRGVVDGAVALAVRISRAAQGQLRPVLDDAFAPLSRELRAGKVLIKCVVAAAPLLGLLGTVTGMIETFDSLAEMSFYSQKGGIAGGIAEALFTTQMGLVVAVPGVIVGRILERRETSLLDELERIKDILSADAHANVRSEAA